MEKKLLGILVLSLCLITPFWADDISDPQIEGMSIGDSLLDHERKIIIYNKDLNDKWHDFLLNINWTDKQNGFVKVWINNQKVYESNCKTIGKIIKRKKDGVKMGPSFRFGIYNGKRFKPVKTQVVYYDSFKSGKKCKKTALFHDCKNLPIEIVEKIDWSKCDEEGLVYKPLSCYGSDGKIIPKSERISN